jgi:membrane-bound lytic murein transglycosylase MltF
MKLPPEHEEPQSSGPLARPSSLCRAHRGAGRRQAEAAKRGLDPNVWFRNVDYVAAEKIGPETVTYVSNIYRYYIGYRLVLESRAAEKAAIEKVKGSAK